MKRYLFLTLTLILLVVSCTLAIKEGIVPPPIEPVSARTQPPLRQLAKKQGLNMGAAVTLEPFKNDPIYQKVLSREFNMIMPENAMKFDELQPQQGQFNFTKADELVALAKAHNLKVIGHTLVWERGMPAWLRKGKFTRDELIEILHDHIQTVVSHYRGQVAAWDAVNESLARDGSLKDTLWLRGIGPEYIDLAFRWAHEADPEARLFYNEYATIELNQKTEALINLLKGLLERGVPINGVGLQTHIGLPGPKREKVAAAIRRLSELGLEVQISEMDVGIRDGKGSREKRLKDQAVVYGDIMGACLSVKACTNFMFWGFTDRYSWSKYLAEGLEAPLIFDDAYRPKPAYNALVKELVSVQR